MEDFQTKNVADSTTEGEYIAASEASKEAFWIKKCLEEIGVAPSVMNPIALYCDNSGVNSQAMERRSHMKTRHIERKYHIVRQYIEKVYVKILKIHMDLNVLDPMMKALPRAKHEQHRIAICVKESA